MTRSILALPRLTSDATYQGLPLTRGQYDTSMAILRRVEAAKGRLPAGIHSWTESGEPRSECSHDEHVAWIALQQSGIIVSDGASPQAVGIEWNTIRLTNYGQTYLEQRTEKSS